jgi:hypothetical protein
MLLRLLSFLGVHFIMPHGRWPGGGYPVSRDWGMAPVQCEVRICPCNSRGQCELPASIKINIDGKSQTGLEFIEKAKGRDILRKPRGTGL